ncbi:type 1 glutamine amidotransferase [Granulicella aggregans]|uniref:Type 1 glutamine amidotransferase n=1 Tax=Granulicella aggregans TaxID=474949 RepID=A0A7W8E3V0_9BACT|nr:ThuA domain-containing protein [Granulicella aggregans]MBB5057962.1 type 1 glutamine amidotransferase [Granulicella aggregans]
MIRKARAIVIAIMISNVCVTVSPAQQKSFHVLALYSKNVETDHVLFAEQAIHFLNALAVKEGFECTPTENWDDLNPETLAHYQVVIWLNDSPNTEQQREAFQKYMSHGGAWLGFHASGYNDSDTHWPWFVDFLGGAVFYGNSWPPLPAKLRIDDRTHPVAKGIPSTYQAPANEWYIWRPDPRDNPDVKVLLTLDPSNYPLGLKDVLVEGDLPVVWTNRRYKMIYMNMGHGDQIFSNPVQNQLIANAVRWLGDRHTAISPRP